MTAKKPEAPPEHKRPANMPTTPTPPRKRLFPPVTLVGIDALAVGQVVDDLENTIRMLLGRARGVPWNTITRKEIEAAISEDETITDRAERS